MFNSCSYRGGDTNIKVNAVSGTMVKNFTKSFFLRFQIGSGMEDCLFSKEPKLKRGCGRDNFVPVVVIQSMIIGEKLMLAEVMWKEDFDAMFEDGKE